MQTKRFRGTSISVLPTFGSRFRHLRLRKSWSQEELSRQTSISGGGRISKRIIGSIERSESLQFDRRTLEILATTLGVTLDSLLDNTPPFVQTFPSFRPSTIFTKTLEEIGIQILAGEQLIVIQGESGVGKSRLASSLFSIDLPNYIVFWFTGSTLIDFKKLFSFLTKNKSQSSQRYLIILDEDHQPPVRDLNFFLDIFQLSNLNSIKQQISLFCCIRNETYQALSDLGAFVNTYLISLENQLDQIDDYRAWHLDQPISEKQKKWLERELTGDDGKIHLNTFLLDKVYLPSIRQKNWTKFNFNQNQIIETVYQGLIRNQSSECLQLYRSIQWSTEISDRTPLYLVNAVLNSQSINKSSRMTIQQTRNIIWKHKFTRVEQRPFFDQKPIWKNIYYTNCRFSHDLIREVIDVKYPFSDHIDLELVVKELIETIRQQKNRLVELIESLASWLSLLNQQNRGFPQLSQLISCRIAELIDSGQCNRLDVGYYFFTMCWFLWGNQFKNRNDLRNPSIFRDIELVTESIVSRFQPEDLDVICEMRDDGGSNYPLVSCFSGWFSSLGRYSSQLKNEPFWGLLESEIPCLSNMAKRLTTQSIEINQVSPLTLATLYIWSGKYEVVKKYFGSGSRNNGQDLKSVKINFNYSRLLSQIGDFSELIKEYQRILAVHASRSAQDFFHSRTKYITSNSQKSKKAMGYRNFEKSLTDLTIYDPDQEILIIDASDMVECFIIGDMLNQSEINHRIIDGIILNDLTVFPDIGRFIIIGKGHYGRMIDLVSRHISEKSVKKIVQSFVSDPYYGWHHFDIEERKLVWITGGWEEKRKEAVIKWFKSESSMNFLNPSAPHSPP